jgi:hypothetical protein
MDESLTTKAVSARGMNRPPPEGKPFRRSNFSVNQGVAGDHPPGVI